MNMNRDGIRKINQISMNSENTLDFGSNYGVKFRGGNDNLN